MAGTAERGLAGIVGAAAEGDEVAFGQLVDAYQAPMYCVCMAFCRDRDLAEEAVASAWSKIWQKLGTVREPDRLRPWVVSVAVNEARQLLRRRRRRSLFEVALDPVGQAEGTFVRDRPRDPDADAAIDRLDLRDALRRLGPDDRALLTMRYVLGFDATELSQVMGTSPAGIRQRLRRLLARLRQELE